MALEGSERKILHAILREQVEAMAGYVDDSRIADFASLSIEEVRDCLETLEGKECVQRSLGVHGYSAYITAKGRQELRRSPDISGGAKPDTPLKIVPKGLRSFDAEDQDFFLELLPGPRRGDGLPESVHFWKVRIEEMDPDKTFRVGYIFGPSGCGKSSLVKAGLIPRLSKSVSAIYVEATGEETETRLLRGLRKHKPDLAADLDLHSSLVNAREAIRGGSSKILLVIDQFEQWYHARGAEPETELGTALRECDGGRVQTIILVRDDFSMALHRFMAAIGVRQNQDQNFAVVDLFDLEHACKVLIAFGRGYGKLPDDSKEMTASQNEFVDRTIQGLSQEGRVISVRVALFAEMLKGKPWTPETLKQVGGAEGVGVTFLEETFSARTAPPSHRIHQKAAQAVVKSLLPESGSNIKGNMRSYDELLVISGYGSRPREFDELIRILNSELRLISPTEAEGSESEGQTTEQKGEKFFLLTHDYLVPSIREWLTHKQKETRRGRAELTLVDRSSLWNAKPENRHLPSLLEWASIGLLTRKTDWTDPQRRMMRRAGRVLGVRGLVVLLLLIGATLTGLAISHRVGEASSRTYASGLVQQLLRAEIDQVPEIVRVLPNYRRWTDPELKRIIKDASGKPAQKLHAQLALLPVDDSQVPFLEKHLLNATPTELPVLRDALRPHQATLIPELWSALDAARPGHVSLLPAASALADYDAANTRWETVGAKVAQALVSVNPVYLAPWLEALRPVRESLNMSLSAIFRDKGRPETERTLATSILIDYAQDDPEQISNLLMDAEPKAFVALFPVAKNLEAKTLPVFRAGLREKVKLAAEEKNPEPIKDRLAERRARAAIALLRMGEVSVVIPILCHSPDPRLRSFMINCLKPSEVDPKTIAAELDRLPATAKPTPAQGQQFMASVLFHPEISQRRALILALGTYGTDGLSPAEREPLIAKLLDLFRNDPDSGIHGVTAWTLRQWGERDRLKTIDADLMKLKDKGDRRWFVNSQGQTFAVIEPVEFQMGSPPTEPDRNDRNETPHRRIIPRRFAIAATEVSVRQFQAFLRETPALQFSYLKKYSPDPDGPQISVTWYEAVAYCNWLSRQEKLSECYEPNSQGQYEAGMKIKPDALSLGGYRLPTEGEWEYACRAGAETSRYYGASVDLLGRYAWYSATSQDHAWSCGSLLPNDLGLFDMLGNTNEWGQEVPKVYRPDDRGRVTEPKATMHALVDDTNPRLLRSGTFSNVAAYHRSGYRSSSAPSYRSADGGFRPSRTYP
jgi:formylglycine-generating enzyme required for sulfatase activity